MVSIAAGKSLAWTRKDAFGKSIKLVRCMPNTPAMVMAGCSSVCRNERVTEEDMAFCMEMFERFRHCGENPERELDAAGAVSGSSPLLCSCFWRL